MSEVTAQRARLEQLKAQLDQEYAKDQPNAETVNTTIAEMNKIEQDLATAAQTEQIAEQINQNHEDRMQQSMSSIANDLDNMEAGGFPLRTLFVGEGEYQLGSIAIKRWAEGRESANLNQIKGFEEQLAQLQRQNEYLQTRVKDSDAAADQLKADKAQLETELADAEQKRDAAARELSDANAQLAQIKAQNDELNKQITAAKLGAIPLDPEEKAKRDAEEKAAGEKLRRERYTVYDLKPDRDLNPTKYTAKRAFDNSECEFPAYALKVYTVLTSDTEVQDFRTQYAQAEPVAQTGDANIPLAQSVEPVAEVQFPSETVPTPADHPEVAGQADQAVVTRAEFTALEARVSALEGKQIAQVA